MSEPDDLQVDPRSTSRLVRTVLSAAAAPAEPGPLPGEDAAMAAFRALAPTDHRRKSVRTRTSSRLAAAGVAAGVLLVGGGVASAATGLPSTAADAAQSALSRLGISVGARPASTPSPAASTPASTGSQVSDLARTTTSTGVDKGAAISGLASGGKSKAGAKGTAGSTTATGGTGVADAASGGASKAGTGTAATASGGRSTAGRGNATSAPTPPARP